jgi:hypothetical protein
MGPKSVVMKEIFLAEALNIGHDLLTGIGSDWEKWSQPAGVEQDDGLAHSHLDLYTGVAGQLLFLLELYRLTGEERLRQVISAGLDWLWQQRRAVETDAFLTGATGIALLLARASRFLDEPSYLAQAVDWYHRFHGADRARVEPDYIGGLSGTVVGLLHLHAASGEPRLLEHLEACAAPILRRAKLGPRGIYWDSNPQDVHGLCGLAHGAAGMALAWLNLGRYLKNEALLFAAVQALDYVLHRYDAAHGNWSDYRKYFNKEYEEPARRAYLAADWEHFSWSCFRNSWCNGAAGIGLVLMSAYRDTGNRDYLDKALAALRLTEEELANDGVTEGRQDDIICHGRAGNAELFLEAHRATGDEAYYHRAVRAGEQLMADRARQGSYRTLGGQPALFTGLAGIGYFFCRLADPEGTPSILCPNLDPDTHASGVHHLPTLNLTRSAMRRRLLEKSFPRTLTLLAAVVSRELEVWLAEVPAASEKEGLADFVGRGLGELGDPQVRMVIGDVFDLESTRSAVADGVDANGRLFVKERIAANRLERLRRLDDEDLAKTVLGVDPDTILCQTQWDWSGDDPGSWRANIETGKDTFTVILQPHSRGMREVCLSPLSTFLMSAFPEPAAVETVLAALATSIEEGATSSEEIRSIGLAQIRKLVATRFLVDGELASLKPS